MDIQTIAQIIPVDVHRNAEFETLGTIRETTPNLLVFLESEKFLPRFLANSHIAAVITTPALASVLPQKYGIATSDAPRKAFFTLHNHLASKTDFYWMDFPNEISSDAVIHPSAYIAPRNVRIGRGTVIEPNVTILERTIIGEDVTLRAGCTVGSQGFYFSRIDGKMFNVFHAGGARLHNGVEAQANSAISSSVFHEPTELGEETKLDNLVHIAHNVKIGKRCLLAANAMVAGSVIIGNDVWIGPGASISNEITIGDNASITIGSVVTRDVPPGQRMTGNFAIEHDKYLAFLKTIR
jgi:UDP-3-O-[3-hydroxymyristoyl] glucosamine N-acyltransferase